MSELKGSQIFPPTTLIKDEATRRWAKKITSLLDEAFRKISLAQKQKVESHTILSNDHTDTATATVLRGDIVIGNSTPAWSRLGVGTSSKFLRSDGTDPAWSTIGAADLPSGINAAKISGGSVSNTEFDYLNGVTSAIQTQFSNLIDGTTAFATIDVNGGAIDGVTIGTNSACTELQVDDINVNGGRITSPSDLLLTGGHSGLTSTVDNVFLSAAVNKNVALAVFGTGVIEVFGPIAQSVSAGDMIFQNPNSNADVYYSVNDGGVTRTILYMDSSEMRVGINTATPFAELQILSPADISQGGFTFDARLWNGGSPQLLYTNMSLTGAYGIDIESRNSATGTSAAGIRMRNDGTVSFMTGNGTASPTAKAVATQKGFDVTGLGINTTTKTNTDYTALTTDDVILVSTGAVARTITLPVASTVTGKIYHVKKIDTGGGSVIIDANGSELIDGALTAMITIQYEAITFQSDGNNWYIL